MLSVSIVEKQIEAYNRRDLEAFAACYADDIEVFDVSNPCPRLKGIVSFKASYEVLFNGSPNLHCEILKRMDFGNFVVDEENVTGAQKYPNGLRIGAIYRVESGLIQQVWFTR